MRVKNCTQVFSHTVGTAMYARAKTSLELSPSSEFYLNPKAVETAEVLLFFDQLFDSCNGSSMYAPSGKNLRVAVSSKSEHIQFWQSAIQVLKSMYFTTPGSDRKIVTPSIKNWIFSLESFVYLWKILQLQGFKYFFPRTFNQDPIENFFSCIRSHGVRNINPTCALFVTSYKSLLINNFVSSHSPAANCEEDISEGALDSLKLYLADEAEIKFNYPCIPIPIYSSVISCSYKILKEDYASPYVSGFVVKKLLRLSTVACCLDCKRLICSSTSSSNLPQNLLIQQRQYNKCTLMSPSAEFIRVFHRCTETILNQLPYIILKYNLKKRLLSVVTEHNSADADAIFCAEHKHNFNNFVQIMVNLLVFHYIKNINKLLQGKDFRRMKQDPLFYLAYEKIKKKSVAPKK